MAAGKWRPRSQMTLTPLQKIEKGVNGILNKMAPDKFDKLKTQLCTIRDEEVGG